MHKAIIAICYLLQKERSDDFEEKPQGVLDILHDLRQKLTENAKKEQEAVSTISSLKEKLKDTEEEKMKFRCQIDSTQESLKGVKILHVVYDYTVELL